MLRDIEADERVRKLLQLEPTTAADFSEIERAQTERRVSHAIALKRRLAWLRQRRGQ